MCGGENGLRGVSDDLTLGIREAIRGYPRGRWPCLRSRLTPRERSSRSTVCGSLYRSALLPSIILSLLNNIRTVLTTLRHLSLFSWKGQNGSLLRRVSQGTSYRSLPIDVCSSPRIYLYLCTLLRQLLGVSDEDIAKDYNLTEIGLEPLMPALIARFQKEPRFRDNWEATLKMASAKYVLFVILVAVHLDFHLNASPVVCGDLRSGRRRS